MTHDSNAPTSVEIEWGFDLDKQMVIFPEGRGPDKYHNEIRVKGRHRACWGSLIGRQDRKTDEVTGLRCRVCGKELLGSEATDEYNRMSKEEGRNVFNLFFDQPLEFGEGVFLNKLFPQRKSYTEQDFRKHVESKAAEGSKQGKLTRQSFPVGSPGFFYLQAKLLMESLVDISYPEDPSIAVFEDIEVLDDGSLRIYSDLEELRQDSSYFHNRLAKRMGANMATSMLAAFACELLMKAISLTCKDEAKKIHDLFELFADLPDESRQRVILDFEEIETVLEKQRRSFDSWRYFESSTSEMAMNALIDKMAVSKLAKAARVLMDECEIVGLEGEATVNASQGIRQEGSRTIASYDVAVKVTGREKPPIVGN